MNFNASLDDIIKQNRSKIGLKTRKFRNKNGNKNGKNAKPAFRSNIKKKQNPPVFKAKFKKRKVPEITDARVKILQNKNKLRGRSPGPMRNMNPAPMRGRSPGPMRSRSPAPMRGRSPGPMRSRSPGPIRNPGSMRSPLLKDPRPILQDARLKIEARRQKVEKVDLPLQLKVRRNLTQRDAAVTRLSNGILQRRVSASLGNDNGIRVEYEDDEMSLENETIAPPRGWPERFTLRRTVANEVERKRYPPTVMGYRDLDAEPEDEFMYYDSKDSLPLNEVTRTFTNIKAPPTFRKNYSSRLSSPLRQNTYEEMRDISHSKLLRESPYYRITISNLHENVTSEDIKELFEDIGDLVHAKMVRNGIAEVAYRYEKDAIKAVEAYHNRLLDGIPMKCTFLNNPETSSIKKRHSRIPPVSTHSSIEPDAHIIKKALFNK